MDALIRSFLEKVAKILKLNVSDEWLSGLVQFVKFGIVGVTNTFISYLLNIATLKLLEGYHLTWDYVAANMVAFFLSVLWSFYWNNRYVFTAGEGETRSVWRTLIRTYIAYGFTGIVLTNILSYVWIDIMGISKYIAPIINLIISVPVNFIINKKWAFKA